MGKKFPKEEAESSFLYTFMNRLDKHLPEIVYMQLILPRTGEMGVNDL